VAERDGRLLSIGVALTAVGGVPISAQGDAGRPGRVPVATGTASAPAGLD
jgi:hypothetical protein